MKNTAGGILKSIKLMLTVIGVLPMKFQKGLLRFMYKLNYWYNVIGTFSLFFLNAVSVYARYKESNWSGFFESLSYLSVIGDGVFKVTYLRDEFLSSVCAKVDLYEETIKNSPERYKIYKTFSRLVAKVTAVFIGLAALTFVFFTARPFITAAQIADGVSVRRLMTTYWHPIDSHKHYALAYFTELSMLYSTSQYVIYSDVLVCTLLAFCIVQLKIVRFRLKNVIEYSLGIAREKSIPLSLAQNIAIKEIVVSHQTVIDSVKSLDAHLRLYFLFQFLLSSVRISFTIVNIMSRDLDRIEILTSLSYVTTLSIQICLYYGLGNEIIFQGREGIYNAVALSSYNELCPSARRMLIILLNRANVPLSLSIGSFGIVSFNTLVKIMKSGYYTLSLLNCFQTKGPNK